MACRFFGTPQGCGRGAACRFRHDGPAAGGGGARPRAARSVAACRFFGTPQGCTHGDACRFRHDRAAAQAQRRPEPQNAEDLSSASRGEAVAPVTAGQMTREQQPRMRQWSFGRPMSVRNMDELAADVQFVRLLQLPRHFGGLHLPHLTKLVCRRENARQKAMFLQGLFEALAGHRSLMWLDVSGHLVDRPSRDIKLLPGNAALRKLVNTAPSLTCLRLDDGCFLSPNPFTHFLVTLEGTRVAKVSALRTLDHFTEEDLNEMIDDTPVWKILLSELGRAFQYPQLVELSICPNMQQATAPDAFLHQVSHLAPNLRTTLAYFCPFVHTVVDLDTSHAIVTLLNNARRWSPARHGLFPWAFHQATNQLLFVALRRGIPTEVVHRILGFLAWHYPIVSMDLDDMNHELPFRRQLSMHEYLARVRFPLEGIEESIQERRMATAEHEMQETYSDDRAVRSDADKERDAEYVPAASGRAFEQCLLECLLEDNSPLSTRVHITAVGVQNSALTLYVHLEMGRVVYETIPRRVVLEFVRPKSDLILTVVIRTFFPPVAQPRKHVRMGICSVDMGMVLCPAEMTRLAQTQNGTLADEPFTTYKGRG